MKIQIGTSLVMASLFIVSCGQTNDKANKEVAYKEFLRLFKSNTKENDDILKKYLNLD